MFDDYINSYKELKLKDKREILLKEVAETLNSIEMLCIKKNIDIEKLKSSYFLKNKDVVFEEDFCDLLFIYMIYLKEDLASLL